MTIANSTITPERNTSLKSVDTSTLLRGLFAYFTFTENSGDYSGNDRIAYYYGQLQPDRFGVPASSYYFGDQDAWADLSDSVRFEYRGAFSVSMWLRPDDRQRHGSVVFDINICD